MVVVAIAGGLGGLGQQLVREIQRANEHEVIVLTRKQGKPAEPGFGVEVAPVDYDSISSMSAFFDEKNVHTIISAVSIYYEGPAKSQMNLIQAADASKSVKRFMPSEFHIDYETAPSPIQRFALDCRKVLAQTTTLQYTIFYAGMFTDYLSTPMIPTPMQGWPHILHVPTRTAVIPGDGTTAIVYTHTQDVGKFTAALLNVPVWDKEYHLVGELTTFNDVVKAAESVTGEKFSTTYDPVEKLADGNMTQLPDMLRMLTALDNPKEEILNMAIGQLLTMVEGIYDVSKKGTSLNDTFPEMKTLSVEEYLHECFGEK